MLHPQGQRSHFDMGRGLAALGRGPDSQLVHMSNKEVDGLQRLAMAHGGSLTRNPHTGLLEAGILASILPDIAGVALAATGVGAPLAAGIVAAGDTAITGSWKQGLAAGLGAYGGAGIASSLAGVGAAANAAGAAGSTASGASTAATPAATAAADPAAAQGAVDYESQGLADTTAAPASTPTAASSANPNAIVQSGVNKQGQMIYQTQGQLDSAAQTAARRATEQSISQGISSNGFTPSNTQGVLQNMGTGVKALAGDTNMPVGQAWSDVGHGVGKMGALAAAAPVGYAVERAQVDSNEAQQRAANPPVKLYHMQYHQGTQNPYAGPGQTPILGQGYTTDPTTTMYQPQGFARGGGIKKLSLGGTLKQMGENMIDPMDMGAPWQTGLSKGMDSSIASLISRNSSPSMAQVGGFMDPNAERYVKADVGQEQLGQAYKAGDGPEALYAMQYSPNGGYSTDDESTYRYQNPQLAEGGRIGPPPQMPTGIAQPGMRTGPGPTAPSQFGFNRNMGPGPMAPQHFDGGGNVGNMPPAGALAAATAPPAASNPNMGAPQPYGAAAANPQMASYYQSLMQPPSAAQQASNNTQPTDPGAWNSYLANLNQSLIPQSTSSPTNAASSGTSGPPPSTPTGIASPSTGTTGTSQGFNPSIHNISRGYGVGRGFAAGGLGALGHYSDGGQLLRGPGDGMSDSIPAVIDGAKPQKAALGDGEFVVPADVVSHLGNGSTDAGARKLYSMLDKVRQARTGKKSQAPQVNVNKYLPA